MNEQEKAAVMGLREAFKELHEAQAAQKVTIADMLQVCIEELENPSRKRSELIRVMHATIKLLRGEDA